MNEQLIQTTTQHSFTLPISSFSPPSRYFALVKSETKHMENAGKATETLQGGEKREPNQPVCDLGLTENHKDEEHGGHRRRDVEHDADVTRELVHVVHIGHQDGGDEEPDGDAELEGKEKSRGKSTLKTVVIFYKNHKGLV